MLDPDDPRDFTAYTNPDWHSITQDRGRIFIDYFELRGVTDWQVQRAVGLPLVLTIKLYINDVDIHGDK